jgi:hypothetical protein
MQKDQLENGRDRGPIPKVQRLLRELTDAEKEKNPRIVSYINLYLYSIGGSFDMNEDTHFFNEVNHFASFVLDQFYQEKYGEPLLTFGPLRQAAQDAATRWRNQQRG